LFCDTGTEAAAVREAVTVLEASANRVTEAEAVREAVVAREAPTEDAREEAASREAVTTKLTSATIGRTPVAGTALMGTSDNAPKPSMEAP